eukprot:4576425-Prymnesium_polylepis.2
MSDNGRSLSIPATAVAPGASDSIFSPVVCGATSCFACLWDATTLRTSSTTMPTTGKMIMANSGTRDRMRSC